MPSGYDAEFVGGISDVPIRNSSVPRNFVWGGGGVPTNSVEDRGQRERGSGGGSSPSQGFCSIFKRVKPVFLLGCYGCIFRGTGTSAQLSKLQGRGDWTHSPFSVRHWFISTSGKVRLRDLGQAVKTQRLLHVLRDCFNVQTQRSAQPVYCQVFRVILRTNADNLFPYTWLPGWTVWWRLSGTILIF
jgi:hypothetical protein